VRRPARRPFRFHGSGALHDHLSPVAHWCSTSLIIHLIRVLIQSGALRPPARRRVRRESGTPETMFHERVPRCAHRVVQRSPRPRVIATGTRNESPTRAPPARRRPATPLRRAAGRPGAA
jgi:hypothetical protein